MKIKIILLFFLFVNLHFSYAQNSNVALAIKPIMEKYEAIGLAVAVVKDGKLHYNQSFGYKDLENKTPLQNDNLFRIASISKSFSSTAIMQLIAEKKLKLEDDFSDLIGFKVRNPKYPNTVITLKMVLSHTSSINDSEGYFTLDAINPAKNPNWAKCYNDYEPGKGYQYCNLNFNMVGTIIEKLSGERFDSYINQHILKPLNLVGGYCIDSLNAENFATLYEYDSKNKKFIASPAAYAPRREEISKYQLGYSAPIFSPTGGMKISATDLAKYMMMHMNYGKINGKKIINKKLSQLMQKQVSAQEGYGLALLETTKLIPNVHLVGHTGSAYGLNSMMFFNPKEKYGIVVITNGSNPIYKDGYNTFTKEIYTTLYQHFIK